MTRRRAARPIALGIFALVGCVESPGQLRMPETTYEAAFLVVSPGPSDGEELFLGPFRYDRGAADPKPDPSVLSVPSQGSIALIGLGPGALEALGRTGELGDLSGLALRRSAVPSACTRGRREAGLTSFSLSSLEASVHLIDEEGSEELSLGDPRFETFFGELSVSAKLRAEGFCVDEVMEGVRPFGASIEMIPEDLAARAELNAMAVVSPDLMVAGSAGRLFLLRRGQAVDRATDILELEELSDPESFLVTSVVSVPPSSIFASVRRTYPSGAREGAVLEARLEDGRLRVVELARFPEGILALDWNPELGLFAAVGVRGFVATSTSPFGPYLSSYEGDTDLYDVKIGDFGDINLAIAGGARVLLTGKLSGAAPRVLRQDVVFDQAQRALLGSAKLFEHHGEGGTDELWASANVERLFRRLGPDAWESKPDLLELPPFETPCWGGAIEDECGQPGTADSVRGFALDEARGRALVVPRNCGAAFLLDLERGCASASSFDATPPSDWRGGGFSSVIRGDDAFLIAARGGRVLELPGSP